MKFSWLNTRVGGLYARARQILPGEAASFAALGARSLAGRT
jgi:hypothetical protein